MMKIILSFLVILSLWNSVIAQDKIVVGILPFTFVRSAADDDDVNSIQETVTNAFVKSKRFNIVDRTKMKDLKQEKELQKTEDFLDSKVVAQSASLGASYLISGHVNSVKKTSQMKQRTKLNGTTENYMAYEANISFSCSVIDVSTGEVINSETFSNSGGGTFLGMSLADNIDEAVSSSLRSLVNSIDSWVGKNFPVIFGVYEVVERDGKGNIEKLTILGGSSFNLQRKDRLKVIEVTKVTHNGKEYTRKKEIGELKISKVEDESFSECNVTSGSEQITKLFDSNPKAIQVITTH